MKDKKDKNKKDGLHFNGRRLSEDTIRICKEICIRNGVSPTTQNIVAAHRSYFL